MRFGVHVSVAGGLGKSLPRARDLGCETFQIFIGNPRGWAVRRIDPGTAAAFREARREAGIGPLVVHQTYLPNLASPVEADWRRSLAAFLWQYQDAAAIGAEFYVLHPGSAREGSRTRAVRRVAEALTQGLKTVRKGPVLCLENTAGGGAQLGSDPGELADIAARVDIPERVGVCFDTAHALAAGHGIAARTGMRRMREAYRRAFGRHPIRLLHLNDLRAEPGSRHDRHEHIGRGALGEAGIRNILHTPGLRRLPVILETPVDAPGDDARNLARARALAR